MCMVQNKINCTNNTYNHRTFNCNVYINQIQIINTYKDNYNSSEQQYTIQLSELFSQEKELAKTYANLN